MRLQVQALREYLRSSLWFVPSVCVAGALVLSVATIAVDRGGHDDGVFAFSGSGESARSVLTAIASSIVTLTALVFSLTVVVLQLASSQYSPRVLRSFLRDRKSQVVLGVFLATFTYTMLVLRAVRSGSGDAEFVPALSVHAAYVLTGFSLMFFVMYIHHIASSMQASSIVAAVAMDGVDAVERLYPTVGEDPESESPPPMPDPTVAVLASRSGYLQTVDEQRLFETAERHETVVRVVPAIGDFVPRGSRLFLLAHDIGDHDDLHRSVKLGKQRTMQQDPMFAIRQLVDIAEKALSPGINDPTTAVEAIDRIHELLLLLTHRRIPAPERLDDGGALRLVLPRPDWNSFVALGFDEIRHYGEGSMQVMRRVRAALEDLLEVTPPRRRDALERQLSLLDRAAERGFDDPEDVARARRQSKHG